MLQNEYQWWCEQRIYAKQDGDILYEKECDEACIMLFKQIKLEYNNKNPEVVKVEEVKKGKTLKERILKLILGVTWN